MFNLVIGNDLDALADRLAARLVVARGEDLLRPRRILVPQPGLRRWLEIRIAERCGIAANLDFPAPAEFVWELLRADRPDLPERSPFERDLLRWRLLPLLAELARERRFGALATIAGDESTRFLLAAELAHGFERYQAYRRDLLDAWERGAEPEDWQAEAWRRLVRATQTPHRAHLIGDWIARYHDAVVPPPGLPPRLAAFGCINVSPDVLRFLGVAAQHAELDFYLPSPCRQFWGDVRSERERLHENGGEAFVEADNPLLASLGAVGRDFIAQMFSYDQVQPREHEDNECWRELDRTSLLGRLKADVLDLGAPEAPPLRVADDDNSLQFHIASSPLREVQVLHDRLLALLETMPDLAPRDIAVMTPHIAAYAPYVHAVFGALAPDDPRRIPYTIADRAAPDEHPLVTLFLDLAALPLSRFGAGEICELLGTPALQRRFGLDTGQLDRIAQWLADSGVRWGLDAGQHAAFGAGRYGEFSWEFGLDRLLVGYAAGDDDDLVAGVAPCAAIEGGATDTLDALLRLRDILAGLVRSQREQRTPREWQRLYRDVLDRLFPESALERDERRALDAVRAALDAFGGDAEAAGFDGMLDWTLARRFLAERLGAETTRQRFLAGGVSVCGMVPLRTVPFRVICLLGLNDEAFPRRATGSGLDRLHAEFLARGRRRPGDRSDRDDDRYLFLQLLCAARDVFYLSWVGEDVRDGSAREPSVVVAELRDLVTTRYGADAARLVVRHPLRPFSPRQFDGADPRLFTYRHEWQAAAASRSEHGTPPFARGTVDTPETTAVMLDALRDFLRSPARTFLHETLGLRLPREDVLPEDEDPLALDPLGAGMLRRALVEARLGGVRDDLALWRARGLLPAGRGGETALALARPAADALATALRDMPADIAAMPFTLTLPDGTALSGSLPPHVHGRTLYWTVWSLGAGMRLVAWLNYLALAANVDGAELALFGIKDDALCRGGFGGLDRAAACTQLAALVALYRRGRREALLFAPKSACAAAVCLRKNNDEVPALRAAQAAFEGNPYQRGEKENPYFELAFRGRTPFAAGSADAAEFLSLARAVFAPLLAFETTT